MSETMFCRQCQETSGNIACTAGRGVCGKSPETANLQDLLIRYLEALASSDMYPEAVGPFISRALSMTLSNMNFDPGRFHAAIARARAMLPEECAVPENEILPVGENERSLRDLLLCGLKGISSFMVRAAALGMEDRGLYEFLKKGLTHCAGDSSASDLYPLAIECGHASLKAMELLDDANTSAFGDPVPVEVKTSVGTRPGILVSGHDLADLKQLLEQSKNSGIDIYTHGEMLSAHAYPFLRKYPHLYGNYGGAWHRQNRDFESFRGPVLMTSNCVAPVRKSYAGRFFTTGTAGWPGAKHIPDPLGGGAKNFTEIIALAQKCPPPQEIEHGVVRTGYSHSAYEFFSDRISGEVKSGCIRSFIVLAGCDGRHPAREYYTFLAEKLPADAVILTSGCAKYRFNKLRLGNIHGIPRVLDAGQCGDSYSLVKIVMRLKALAGLDSVNKLPVSFEIAWCGQTSIAVLLALLALGFRDIRIGPTFPAFLSGEVLKALSVQFGIRPVQNSRFGA